MYLARQFLLAYVRMAVLTNSEVITFASCLVFIRAIQALKIDGSVLLTPIARRVRLLTSLLPNKSHAHLNVSYHYVLVSRTILDGIQSCFFTVSCK